MVSDLAFLLKALVRLCFYTAPRLTCDDAPFPQVRRYVNAETPCDLRRCTVSTGQAMFLTKTAPDLRFLGCPNELRNRPTKYPNGYV